MVDLIGDSITQYALLYQSSRAIGTIVPDVTVEEVHHDELVITEHPVETGAAIADHAFKRPAEIEMRVGWSNSTHQAVDFVQQVYLELLDLQAKREPFNVSTGKRQYHDMLIRGLAVTTDKESEFALSCVVSLKQIIITTVGQGGSGSGGSGGENSSVPSETSPVQNNGTQQLSPAESLAAGVIPL